MTIPIPDSDHCNGQRHPVLRPGAVPQRGARACGAFARRSWHTEITRRSWQHTFDHLETTVTLHWQPLSNCGY